MAIPATTSGKVEQRFYPDLKDQVPYHAEVEFRQLRSMIYELLDARPRTLDYTLAASLRVDSKLIPGKTLIVITRQDTVGGWAVQWAANPDGSLKFKGTAVVTPTTTANTYSSYTFICTSETEAMLISYITGGNLQ